MGQDQIEATDRPALPPPLDPAVGLHLTAQRAAGLCWLAQAIPATHFIAISRGIVIRGAGFWDLWQHTAALLVIAVILVAGSARAFRKTVS